MYEIIFRRIVPKEHKPPATTVEFFDVMLARISDSRLLEDTIQELVRGLQREGRYQPNTRREFQKLFLIHRLRVRNLERHLK